MAIAENAYSIRCITGLYGVELEPAQKVCEAEHGQAHEVFDREVN